MRCIIQRVSCAKIYIDNEYSGDIGAGLVVLVAFNDTDNEFTVNYCVEKICNLRIFNDENGKLNRSITDIGGEIMLVSNFTVYGDTSKGRRPSFSRSAKPEISEPLYNLTVKKFKDILPIIMGKFGADMRVCIENDGPVTVIVEKENE